MKLYELLRDINCMIINGNVDNYITSICYDSRKVEENNVKELYP